MFWLLSSIPLIISGGSLKFSHFWDCNGMGCDAGTLQPWNPSEYRCAPGYSPLKPIGGAKYGEQFWMVGAASDALAYEMGGDDGCCGHDSDSGGCGKCALVSIQDSLHPDWKVLVMKKSRCPPNSYGCDQPHFDLAVPGYDNLQYSTANICGQSGTGLSKEQSGILGAWYNSCSNTAECIGVCDKLPSEFQGGCRLFSSWGWYRGDPTGHYEIVECPEEFKKYVSQQFGPNGPSSNPGPTPDPGPTPTPDPHPSSYCCSWDGGNSCGDTSDYCKQSQSNCENDCGGHWVPTPGFKNVSTNSTKI